MDSSESSSDIAAAIVHGAPPLRRKAFLRGLPQRTCSLEELQPGELNRSRKRRSLNLENTSATTSTPGTDFLSSLVSGGVAADADQLQQQQVVGVAYGMDQLCRASPIEEGNEDVHESTPPVHHIQPSTLTLDATTPSSIGAASSTNGTVTKYQPSHAFI